MLLWGPTTLLALAAAFTAPAALGAQTRVLFIGNSLTYANDLPHMVQSLARSLGDSTIMVESIALPDFSLEDHWNDGRARARLAEERWTIVVLQQGPSSLPASRQNLAEWAGRFGPLIRGAGAVPVLYMVWPPRDRLMVTDAVHDAYFKAAEAIHGCFAPAGDAWREAWAADSTLVLYGPDDFHPSPLGSYLAALSLLPCLGVELPAGPPSFIPDGHGRGVLTRQQQIVLLHAAVAAWHQTERR